MFRCLGSASFRNASALQIIVNCQEGEMNKFPALENRREIAQFVNLCHKYYVNKKKRRGFVHTGAALWMEAVDKTVENVENPGFSTVISGFSSGGCLWKSLWTLGITSGFSTGAL